MSTENEGKWMLKTVSVPTQFEPLFEEAEKKVHQFFEQQRQAPEEGTIEIHGSRYVLVRGAAFSVEFFQLVRKIFGSDKHLEADRFSASLLYELAHAVGQSDARNFHETMGLTDPIARLSAGPIHFSHTGWAFVDILPESQPSPDEDFFLVYKHPFSFECDAWLETDSQVEHPVCIMNAGYSSGWCQESFGIPLEAREITCRSLGDESCLFIMAQPQCIEQKINDYIDGHSELELADQQLAFNSYLGSNTSFEQHSTDEKPWHSSLHQRLLTYARNLESTQKQLSENIRLLEAEIEERKRIERELQESEVRWRELTDATFDAILVSRDSRILDWNFASTKLFNVTPEVLEKVSLIELFGEEHREKIAEAIKSGETQITSLQLLQSGKETIVDIQIHQTHYRDKPALIFAVRDVTEQTKAMQRLERLANYDALTGLPNRTRFQRIVNRSILASNFSDKHGMLFLDLDNFKAINDNFGHSAGDLLLYELSRRMSEAIRGNNTICRLGGDEFAVWIPDLECDEDAEQVARQIIHCLKTPIEIQRVSHRVTFSIGIAIYPHDGTDYATLSRHSDTAMYQAKKLGKNRFCSYSQVKR
ncbi:diguanylate cyclase domain-containing protein [Pleionea litopenaei]|uniref:Diguanylate cyclase n=1 Tax=Pleionea litopenaei TaxID=3070815 RepID=A0AA51RTV5_9GAMM|nr:diguanylate cyclase [Pleionea sp. HL-JVS1]WMS87374.1 diguanylate cyclase [Pleionea sp. HL-JVS1]